MSQQAIRGLAAETALLKAAVLSSLAASRKGLGRERDRAGVGWATGSRNGWVAAWCESLVEDKRHDTGRI